jgi:short-subunit dehydrogenase
MQSFSRSADPWREKVVLITGASEGIGASCANVFRQLGAKLTLTALPSDGFADSDSPSQLVVTGDITSAETRIAVVERALDRFGHIDVLINNAGVGQYGFAFEVDVEISKRMFDVNVFSALALTQLVVPHMRAKHSGTIVNIGSVGGKVSLPWAVMYCATKLLSGSGIRVMKVCPGIVDTKFRHHVLAGAAPGRVQDLRRVVSADEVARAIVRGLERRKRTVFVPRIGFIFTSLDFFAPRVMDWYLRGKF